LIDHARVPLGGRYNSDDKFRYGHTVFQNTLTFDPATPTDCRLQNSATIAGNITHKKFTWRAGIDADVGDCGLVYATVSTGYKAGGFGDGCLAGTITFGEACNQPRDPGDPRTFGVRAGFKF
jgi:iron complex outermembrane recepter protein